MAPESCEQCGFDGELYDRADTISSQAIVPAVLRAAIEDMDAADLGRRPNATMWSIAEYLDHVRVVTHINRLVVEAVVANPGLDLGDLPEAVFDHVPKPIDVDRALSGVEREFEAMRKLLSQLDDEQWGSAGVGDGESIPVGWFARHVLHDGLHHFADIGRIRHGFGVGAVPETGVVTQISVSNGGVPKQAVTSATMGPSGVSGDSQNDRRHHGRPIQAVCLWSADVIAELARQGHPIAPGCAGENLTIEDVDWAALRPGARIDVGPVSMLISAHAIPCSKNAQWFSDRDFNRILHDKNPGFSRLYAIPLTSGAVAVGDTVTVEP